MGACRGRGRRSGNGGKVKVHLTGVFPWAGRALNDRLAAWGVASYGQGEITVTPKDSGVFSADFKLWMAARGLRATLMDGSSDGMMLTGTIRHGAGHRLQAGHGCPWQSGIG